MKRKKISVLFMAAAMLASMLGGCAMPSTSGEETENVQADTTAQSGEKGKSGETASGEKITIRVVDWSDAAVSQREAFDQKYMEENPDIIVERTKLTVDQFKNTIVTMIKSGEGPDLFPIPVGMTLDTALNEEWFQPLNDYVTEDFEASFDPKSFAEGVTHKGEDWYTITELMPTIQCLFFYNKDVLDAAGVQEVPQTYSEFREACRMITENGGGSVYGIIDGG